MGGDEGVGVAGGVFEVGGTAGGWERAELEEVAGGAAHVVEALDEEDEVRDGVVDGEDDLLLGVVD